MKKLPGSVVKAGFVLAGLAAWNELSRFGVGPITTTLGGTNHFYPWREGYVYYEEAGPADAPPLLLLHGFNAAASSHEMRKVFPAFTNSHHVFAPDLLGYGQSNRPAIEYTADVYIDLINDFVRDVIERPVTVIASSLTCAHLIAAVDRHPERYDRLVLICPTGVNSLVTKPGLVGTVWHWFLRTPVVGTAVFTALVSKPSLRYYSRERTYVDPANVSDRLIDDYYVESHQPGAKWAPLSFISAYLNRDVSAEWARLSLPVLIIWGREASFTPLARMRPFLNSRPQTAFHVFDGTGILPHDESADEFNAYVKQWIAAGNGQTNAGA